MRRTPKASFQVRRPVDDERVRPTIIVGLRRTRENCQIASLVLRLKTIPMWIFHGDKDETVPVEQSRRLVAALKKAGADVRYTEYPGANHVGAAQMANAETDMIEWLFKQHR